MTIPSLTDILTDPAQIIAYNDDPFDPDAIARLRPSAYMKAKVEDRLYKIRHSMNIQGEVRVLAQFEPPVDVRQLVRTAAGGSDVLETANASNLQIPYYRFPVMLEKAKSLAAAIMQLGASLLGALEKKDAEELALLSATQEKALLNLTTYLKEQQLNEAAQAQSALQESLKSARYRLDHFNGLLEKGLSATELLHIDSMTAAMIANSVAGTIESLAATAYAAPQLGSPFAMTYGGQQVGSSLMAAKKAAEIYAMVTNYLAQLSLTMAGYQRRTEEWQLQAQLASYDVAQLNYQLAAGDISLYLGYPRTWRKSWVPGQSPSTWKRRPPV